MDGACSTHGGEEECIVFLWERKKEDLDTGGRIISKWILEKWFDLFSVSNHL
jgi:hypothetical protein